MKYILLTVIILFFGKSYAQNKLEGLILDKKTGKPIEYANIYNKKDFTSSNADGKFLFQSIEDSIHIQILGYESIHSIFTNFKTDTIYLESRFELLEEVILSDPNAIKTVFKSVPDNYPFEPFTESFFLRCVIKKDGQIVKLQDLNGLVHRKTLLSTSKNPMPKNNYTVEVLNMRKAGIKDREIYFEMFSLEQFLTAIISIAISPKEFDFTETKSDKEDLIKYEFSLKNDLQTNTTGYYLVNSGDNAFNEFHLLNIDNQKEFQERKGVKYRTIYYNLFVTFEKDDLTEKYYLDKAKLVAKVEVMDTNKKPVLYDSEYLWIASKSSTGRIGKKVSLSKDIFKLNKPYNEEFWKLQNHLLLTDEMKMFIADLDDSDNDFKIRTNFQRK